MASTINLLFYSPKCQTCVSLMNILKSEGLAPYFKYICVEENLNRLPKQVSRVPTALIPSMNKFLVCEEIFNWIRTIKMGRNQRQQDNIPQQVERHIPQQTPQQKTQPSQNSHAKPQNNPNGFITSEMAGLSDSYAFTSVDIAPAHSYQTYTDLDKTTIFTAPEQQNKITNSTQPAYIDITSKRRVEQDNEINDFWKTQRSNISSMQLHYDENDKLIKQLVEKQQNAIINSYDIGARK